MVYEDPETGKLKCSNCDAELYYDFFWVCPECGGAFSPEEMRKVCVESEEC